MNGGTADGKDLTDDDSSSITYTREAFLTKEGSIPLTSLYKLV